MEPAPPSHHEYPFRFTGSGREYFGIWIVNLLLTLITLGLYLPWAKVRTRRYFYGHTRVADAPFDYLANPVAILKGWLIALAVIIVYQIAIQVNPLAAPLFAILFLLALPWIVVRSLMFKARNSAWRAIRFNFNRAYGEAVKVFIGLGLLVPLTFGLALPYQMYAMKRFVANNSAYGRTPFALRARALQFYGPYLFAGLVFIGLAALLGALLFPAMREVTEALGAGLATDPGVCTGLRDSGVHCLEETGTPPDPEVIARLMGLQLTWLAGLGLTYLLIYAYLQARLGNLVFNHLTLDSHAFRSSLRARDLLWLYLSNAVAIVLSLGLLVPWARVRLARYRADHLSLVASGDLDGFVQDQTATVGAAGEELGEVFDIDIGL